MPSNEARSCEKRRSRSACSMASRLCFTELVPSTAGRVPFPIGHGPQTGGSVIGSLLGEHTGADMDLALRPSHGLRLAIVALGAALAGCGDGSDWTALNERAKQAHRDGRIEQAEKLWTEALATVGESEDERAVMTLNNLGELERSRDALDRAVDYYRRAAEVQERLAPADDLAVARSWETLGGHRMTLNDPRGAAADFERALDRRVRIQGQNAADVAATRNNLGLALFLGGEPVRAEEQFRQAIAVIDAGPLAENSSLVGPLTNLSQILADRGELAEAEALLERALKVLHANRIGDPTRVARSEMNLAGVLRRQGRLDEAEALYRGVVAAYEARLGADHPDTAEALANLGLVLRELGRRDEAETSYRRALAILEAAGTPAEVTQASARFNLGRLLAETGRVSEAAAEYERVLPTFERAYGASDPRTNLVVEHWASAARAAGDVARADELDQRLARARAGG
jgi:tetratricopeptide (TPR) repeat protein